MLFFILSSDGPPILFFHRFFRLVDFWYFSFVIFLFFRSPFFLCDFFGSSILFYSMIDLCIFFRWSFFNIIFFPIFSINNYVLFSSRILYFFLFFFVGRFLSFFCSSNFSCVGSLINLFDRSFFFVCQFFSCLSILFSFVDCLYFSLVNF